jgi:hypothetical protein
MSCRPTCLCCWHENCDHDFGPWTEEQLECARQNLERLETAGREIARQFSAAAAKKMDERLLECLTE